MADLAHDWASTCRGGHPNAPSESSREANYITDPNHPVSAPFWKLGQNTAVGEFNFEMYVIDSGFSLINLWNISRNRSTKEM